jgi:hypothetical protein
MSGTHSVIDLSTSIALLSLVISGVALFFSQLRAPRLSQVSGPEFQIYYPQDGGFGVYLPVSFLNKSPNTGTIVRCGITLFKKSNPEERFYMEWRFFIRLGPDSNPIKEELAHAITVPGMSSVTKTIWLTWRANSVPQIQIVEGEYAMVFHYWTHPSGKPNNDCHEFYIDKATQSELESYRSSKQSYVVTLALDKKFASNKLLTSYEANSLFGV